MLLAIRYWIVQMLMPKEMRIEFQLFLVEKLNEMEQELKDIAYGNNLKGRCPICEYLFDDCQCYYAGSAHPDRSARASVVFDHMYLFDTEQIKHIRKVQHHWQISYTDSEKNQILKELETQTGALDEEE